MDISQYAAISCQAVGLVLSYLFGLIIYAIQNYSTSKIEELIKGLPEEPRARITRLDARWQELYDTTIFFRLVANMMVVVPLFSYGFAFSSLRKSLVAFAAIIGVLVVLAVVGYIIPRGVSRLGEEAIFMRFAPMVNYASYLMYPFTAASRGAERLVGRLAGGKRQPMDSLSEEEILDIVSDGEAQGVIEEQERDMIEKIFRFDDVPVGEVMTQRTGLTVIPASASLEEATRLAVDDGHSRFPVVDGDRDNVIGILYVKDLLKHWGDASVRAKDVRSIMRPPFFVPETKGVAELFADFKTKQIHFAVVLDEYGGTAGVITVEDIVEEIVGEIVDEYDYNEKEMEIRRRADNVFEINAKVEIGKINAELGLEMPIGESYGTIGGLLLEKLGHIPIPGETAAVGNCTLKVLDADARSVKMIELTVASRPGMPEA
ncbi:MAG: CBS domain-containing protein [Candidatus Brocadiia bacterium]